MFGKKTLIFALGLTLTSYKGIRAEEFELSFLDSRLVDKDNISWVSYGISKGTHNVEVVLNGTSQGYQDITFKEVEGAIKPCFYSSQLDSFKIVNSFGDDNTCHLLSDIDDKATNSFQPFSSKLTVSLPDILIMKNLSYVKVNKDKWEHGISHVKAAYNGYYSRDIDSGTYNSYINTDITGSFNEWRLVTGASFHQNQDETSSNLYHSYIYRDVDSLYAQAQFGAVNTGNISSINSNVPVWGANLGTEKLMLDSQWYSYVPVIKGMATTDAIVSVYQGDTVVYSRNVPPGEFEINDVQLMGVGNELTLVIEESSGRKYRRQIPYGRLPSMLKEGAHTFFATVGSYRGSTSNGYEPLIGAFQYELGFGSYTPRSSMLLSEDYHFLDVGISKDLGVFGAVSLDAGVSHYTSKTKNQDNSIGNIVKGLYSKNIVDTGTTLQLIGYQYRSEEFRTFEEFINESTRSNEKHHEEFDNFLKHRYEATINQTISDLSLYLSYQKDIFHNDRTRTSAYSSLYKNIYNISLGLNFSFHEEHDKNKEYKIGMDISIPFGGSSNHYARLSYENDLKGRGVARTTLNGPMGENSDYNVSVGTSHSEGKIEQSDTYANVRYQTRVGDYSSSISNNRNSTVVSLSASGGVVLSEKGSLLTTRTSSTSALVDYGSGGNIIVNNDKRLVTNSSGLVLVPYSTSYSENSIRHDATKSSKSEVLENDKSYTPREGALSYIKVENNQGLRKFIRISSENNLFGYPIMHNGKALFYVGADNVAYISGISDKVVNNYHIPNEQGGELCRFAIDSEIDNISKNLEDIHEVSCD